MAQHWTEGVSILRFTAREFQQELVEAARSHNVIACPPRPAASFVALKVIQELAYQVRRPSDRRTVLLTVERRLKLLALDLCLLTDLKAAACLAVDQQDPSCKDVFDNNEVLVMTSEVLSHLMNDGLMSIAKINLLIIEECHTIATDIYLQQVMDIYSKCQCNNSNMKQRIFDESACEAKTPSEAFHVMRLNDSVSKANRPKRDGQFDSCIPQGVPRILAFTYPLFAREAITELKVDQTYDVEEVSLSESDVSSESESCKDSTSEINRKPLEDSDPLADFGNTISSPDDEEESISSKMNEANYWRSPICDIFEISQDIITNYDSEHDNNNLIANVSDSKLPCNEKLRDIELVNSELVEVGNTNALEEIGKDDLIELKIDRDSLKNQKNDIVLPPKKSINDVIDVENDLKTSALLSTEEVKEEGRRREEVNKALDDNHENKNTGVCSLGEVKRVDEIDEVIQRDKDFISMENVKEIELDGREENNLRKSTGRDSSYVKDHLRSPYDKLECQLEKLEKMLCSEVDMASDIVGLKRITGRPTEVILEYKSSIEEQQSRERRKLESYMQQTVRRALIFMQDHRYDPTEIYGEETFGEELRAIPDPLLDPRTTLQQFLYILEQTGPYGADKAAHSLLVKIEKLKVKIPYERHFLLLCLVSSVLVQIRAAADMAFEKLDNEQDRIKKFTTPKVLRLMEVFRLFIPNDSVDRSIENSPLRHSRNNKDCSTKNSSIICDKEKISNARINIANIDKTTEKNDNFSVADAVKHDVIEETDISMTFLKEINIDIQDIIIPVEVKYFSDIVEERNHVENNLNSDYLSNSKVGDAVDQLDKCDFKHLSSRLEKSYNSILDKVNSDNMNSFEETAEIGLKNDAGLILNTDIDLKNRFKVDCESRVEVNTLSENNETSEKYQQDSLDNTESKRVPKIETVDKIKILKAEGDFVEKCHSNNIETSNIGIISLQEINDANLDKISTNNTVNDIEANEDLKKSKENDEKMYFGSKIDTIVAKNQVQSISANYKNDIIKFNQSPRRTRSDGHMRGRGRGRGGRGHHNNQARYYQYGTNNDPDALCGLVLVEDPLMAKVLCALINEYCRLEPQLRFVLAQYTVDKVADPVTEPRDAEMEHKLQEEVLKRFRIHECNILVGTAVLEEGMDLPKCNLVVRWDPPTGYRSHARCRARARAPRSLYAMLAPPSSSQLVSALARYTHVERMLVKKCGWKEPGASEEAHASKFSPLVEPYRPSNDAVTLSTAVQLLNRYCAKLPSDTFTRLVPLWSMESIQYNGRELFICTIRLPINCPLKHHIVGHPMPTRVLARRIAALQACRALHRAGELDDNLLPIGKESFRALEPDWLSLPPASDINIPATVSPISPDHLVADNLVTGNNSQIVNLPTDNFTLGGIGSSQMEPRPGTTKRKQYYYKKVARSLSDCRPVVGELCLAYSLKAWLACPLPERHNTRGRKLHPPEAYSQGLAILTTKTIHEIPIFPMFTRSGEVQVSLSKMEMRVRVSARRARLIHRFMRYTFADVLRVRNHLMVFDAKGREKGNSYYVVPTTKVNNEDGSTSVVVDWNFLELIYEHTNALKLQNTFEAKASEDSAVSETVCHEIRQNSCEETVHQDNSINCNKDAEVLSEEKLLNSDLLNEDINSQQDKVGSTEELLCNNIKKVIVSNLERENDSNVIASSVKNVNETEVLVMSAKLNKKELAKIGERKTQDDGVFFDCVDSGISCDRIKRGNDEKPGNQTALKFADSSKLRSDTNQNNKKIDAENPVCEVLTDKNCQGKNPNVEKPNNVELNPNKLDNSQADIKKHDSVTLDNKNGGDGTVGGKNHDTKTLDGENSEIETERNKLTSNVVSDDVDIIDKDETSSVIVEQEFLQNPYLAAGETFVFDSEKYRDAVVMPWYRNQDQPQYFYVAEICWNLSPLSGFPSSQHTTFADYYRNKYGAVVTQPRQPLLDVDHTSARLNLLTPRFVNRKGVALPTSSERTKKAHRESLEQKQILVPELCGAHPFRGALWRAAVALPCVLYRINSLLLADEIRRSVASKVALGTPRPPPGKSWPPLDFGWSLADVLTGDPVKSDEKVDSTNINKEETEEVSAQQANTSDLTANEILKEKESADKGSEDIFEIGTWTNDMAASVDSAVFEELDEHDEDMIAARAKLPGNLTICTAADGGVDWSLSGGNGSTPKHSARQNNQRKYSVADSDASYISSDFGMSDDGSNSSDMDSDEDDDEDTGDQQDLVSENGGIRIEFKSGNEAEAIDVPMVSTEKSIHPHHQQIQLDYDEGNRDQEQYVESFKNFFYGFNENEDDYTKKHIEKFRRAIATNEIDIIKNGVLISQDKSLESKRLIDLTTNLNPEPIKSLTAGDSISKTIIKCKKNCKKITKKPCIRKKNNAMNIMKHLNHRNSSKVTEQRSDEFHVSENCDIMSDLVELQGTMKRKMCDSFDVSKKRQKVTEVRQRRLFNLHNNKSKMNIKKRPRKHKASSVYNKMALRFIHKFNTQKCPEISNEDLMYIKEILGVSGDKKILEFKHLIPRKFMHVFYSCVEKEFNNDSLTEDDLMNRIEAEEDKANPIPDVSEKAMSKKEIIDLYKEMFPYEKYPSELDDFDNFGLMKNGCVNLEDIERNKRKILNKIKATLPVEDWKKFNFFAMKDLDEENFRHDLADGTKENQKSDIINKMSESEHVKEGFGIISDELEETTTESVDVKSSGFSFSFDYQPDLRNHPGPSPSIILQALTMSNANDGINLERLETIGDSFLKYAITTYLYCTYQNIHEGKLSHLRSKQVSNLNLYRLGRRKSLGCRMVACKFEPHDNWLPPCHRVPAHLERALIDTKVPPTRWNVAEMPFLKNLSKEEVERLVKESIAEQHSKAEGISMKKDTEDKGKKIEKLCPLHGVNRVTYERQQSLNTVNKESSEPIGKDDKKASEDDLDIGQNEIQINKSAHLKNESEIMSTDVNALEVEEKKITNLIEKSISAEPIVERDDNLPKTMASSIKSESGEDVNVSDKSLNKLVSDLVCICPAEDSKTVDIPETSDSDDVAALEGVPCFVPYNLITQHSIPDKSVADCVEALIGAYLIECGPRGALLFMAWLGIRVLPKEEIILDKNHPSVRAIMVKREENECKRRNEIKSSVACLNVENFEGPIDEDGDTSTGEAFDEDQKDEEDLLDIYSSTNKQNDCLGVEEDVIEEGESDFEEAENEDGTGWENRIPGSLKPYLNEKGEWIQVVYGELLPPPSPLLRFVPDPEGELMQMLSGYEGLEETLCYRFRDRCYLLQAMTHASYSPNRLTDCYQRLEFLGDAVLDYLITRQLYEDPRRHSPGALTDLRSALVNNTIFASLAVRHGMHKYFRHLSPGLNEVLARFVRIQESNGHSISEEYCLMQEDECEQAEDVEVPKALGDLFESVAGAIFLDSGMSLDAVWNVYHRLMQREIEAFSESVPKSPVRELLEMEPETAKFGKPEKLADGRRVRVTVEVLGAGAFKGVGRNYRIAKCTAAKCALRHLAGPRKGNK